MSDLRDGGRNREGDLARYRDLADTEHPMHVGALCVFDAAVGFDEIAERVAARVAGQPRLSSPGVEGGLGSILGRSSPPDRRQLVERIVAPAPGGTADLAATVGELWSRPLPGDRFPWQLWLVEGLAGGRTALLAKGHRSLVDERGSVELVELLLGPARAGGRSRSASTGHPLSLGPISPSLRPPLVAGAVDFARDALSFLSPSTALVRAREAMRWVESATLVVASPAPETPVNGVLGRERRIGWVRLSRDVLVGIEESLGASREEVLLAIIADALGRYLERRGRVTFALELNAIALPAATPSSAPEGAGAMMSLPVGAIGPEARLAAIRSALREPEAVERLGRLDRILDLCLALPAPARSAAAALACQSVNTICVEARRPKGRIEAGGRSPSLVVPIEPLPWNVGLGFGWHDGGEDIVVGITADARLVPDTAPIETALRAACTEAAASAGVPAIDPESRRLAS